MVGPVVAGCLLAMLCCVWAHQKKMVIWQPGGTIDTDMSEYDIEMCAAYRKIDNYLTALMPEVEMDANMRAVGELLTGNQTEEGSPVHSALVQFSGIVSADCFKDGLELMEANYEAIRRCGRKLDVSGRSEVRRIEKVFQYYRGDRINRCQPVYSEGTRRRWEQLDRFELDCVHKLTLGTLRGLLVPLYPITWIGGGSNYVEFFTSIPFRLSNSMILMAQQLPNNFYYKALVQLASASSSSTGDELLEEKRNGEKMTAAGTRKPAGLAQAEEMFERYLETPCKHYVEKLGPIMRLARMDLELVDPIISEEAFMSVVELWFGKACFNQCRKLLQDRRAKQEALYMLERG